MSSPGAEAAGQATTPAETDEAGGQLRRGMACVDTSGNRRIPVLMDMVAAISRARDPKEVLREFGRGFRTLQGPQGYVSISTRGLGPGEYKVTRLITGDEDSGQRMGEADPWKSWDAMPVRRGGFFGEVIRTAYPEIIHHLQLRDDPVVGDRLAKYGSLMAIPLFDDGEPLNWSITLREDPEGFSVEELEHAILRANLGGAAVKNSMITRELREANARIRREIDQIARIQRSLLPHEVPHIPGLAIGVSYKTFDTAGGDIYDFVPAARLNGHGWADDARNGADRPWGIIIADASGHGPAAATVVAMLNAILYAYPHADGHDSPGKVMEFANRHLYAKRIEGTFVTAILGRYEPATRTFTYARAGHPPALLMTPGDDGFRRRLDEVGGIPLGVMENVRYEEHTLKLRPGQTLVLYTDGITEALSPDGVMFGVEGIENSLEECSGEPNCVINHVTGALQAHEAEQRPSDDQTIVAIRVT